MTAVKFCGLRREEDVNFASIVRCDYAGFILTKRFKRFAGTKLLRKARRILSSDTKIVGVFVDEPVRYPAELINEGIIDIAQLHGVESDDYIKELRDLTDGRAKISKAFIIRSGEDLNNAQNCSSDYLLLDSGSGSGKTFDWELLKQFGKDYFLAGGLDPYNVYEAVRKLKPFAVDVSSGIETDSVKDKSKMELFASEVRRASKEDII